jgi:hypothetical protein
VIEARNAHAAIAAVWHDGCTETRSMTESNVRRAEAPPAPDFGDLLEDALLQAKNLVQAELSLARREVVSELSTAAHSLVTLVVGLMLLQAALATLGVLLVLSLGVSVASGGVVLGFALLGAVAVLYARRSLAQRKLARTTSRVALDAKQVMETVK